MYTRKRRFLTDGGPVCTRETAEGVKKCNDCHFWFFHFYVFYFTFLSLYPCDPLPYPFSSIPFPSGYLYNVVRSSPLPARYSTRYMFIHTWHCRSRTTCNPPDRNYLIRREPLAPNILLSSYYYNLHILDFEKNVCENVISQKSWTTSILRDARTYLRIALLMHGTVVCCMGFVSAVTVYI